MLFLPYFINEKEKCLKNKISQNFLILMIALMSIMVIRIETAMRNGMAEFYIDRWFGKNTSTNEFLQAEPAVFLPAEPETQEELSVEQKEEIAPQPVDDYAEPEIRVLLTGESGYLHKQFEITFEKDYYIQNGQEVYLGEGGTVLRESDIEALFARQKENNESETSCIVIGIWENGAWNMEENWRLRMDSEQLPEKYQGILVIRKAEGTAATDAAGYYLVNTLPLESYLCYVLPSEMPSDFPEEALKAQAVCARSYAMLQMNQERLSEYGADVDDTTAFQVYHAQETTPAAIQAVEETEGIYLSYEEEPIEAFYYACSCGHSTTAEIWRDRADYQYPYLIYKDYGTLEEEVSWYRWEYDAAELDLASLKNRLSELLADRPDALRILEVSGNHPDEMKEVTEIGKMQEAITQMNSIQKLEVAGRLEGDVADELMIVSGRYHIMVESEYCIRKVLAADGYRLTRQDGSISDHLTMVPSGFFELETVKSGGNVSGFLLQGGGFGHGVGMSQYGAKYLAEAGYDYQYILTYYYENVTIEALRQSH